MTTNQNELTFQAAKSPADAAAMWWASVLRDPKLDNGDNNPMTAMLTALSKEKLPSQPMDGLEQFACILAKRLNQQLEASNGDDYISRHGIGLNVDYHPDMLLSECADQAGLRSGMTDWPWKTHMWVKPNEVSVSYGYRAEVQVIWTKSS